MKQKYIWGGVVAFAFLVMGFGVISHAGAEEPQHNKDKKNAHVGAQMQQFVNAKLDSPKSSEKRKNIAKAAENKASNKSTTGKNVILVVTDDLRYDDMKDLPGLRNFLNNHGKEFSRTYSTYSLCCPSRATFLTGQYAHNNKVKSNTTKGKEWGGAQGGYTYAVNNTSVEQDAYPTYFENTNYRTAFIGKYLNGYRGQAVPPGYDYWFAREGSPAGNTYNINGKTVKNNIHDTYIYRNKALQFISASEDPFVMSIYTDAPHQPANYAPKHEDRKRQKKLNFNKPSFDEADVSDKPAWIRKQDRLKGWEKDRIQKLYQNRLRSMLSVEEMMRDIKDRLKKEGEWNNTYVIFTSDNGFHFGEHRLAQGKRTAYKEDIHIPMWVIGGSVPKDKKDSRIIGNHDFAPTIADMTGVAHKKVDGSSFLPLIEGKKVPWRKRLAIEGYESQTTTGRSEHPDYNGFVNLHFTYVEYPNGERELYDHRTDPYEIKSRPESFNRPLWKKFAGYSNTLKDCEGASCRKAEGF